MIKKFCKASPPCLAGKTEPEACECGSNKRKIRKLIGWRVVYERKIGRKWVKDETGLMAQPNAKDRISIMGNWPNLYRKFRIMRVFRVKNCVR